MCPYDKLFSLGHRPLASIAIHLLSKKKNKNPMNLKTKKNTWTLILKVIITVATAVAGALGLNACI